MGHELRASPSAVWLLAFSRAKFVRFRSLSILSILVDASRRPRLRSARAVHRCEKRWRRPLSRLIIDLRRRHRLICCQLVDLFAFLVESMSGRRTDAAAQNCCLLFKPRLQIPLIHDQERSILAYYAFISSAMYGKALLYAGAVPLQAWL